MTEKLFLVKFTHSSLYII